MKMSAKYTDDGERIYVFTPNTPLEWAGWLLDWIASFVAAAIERISDIVTWAAAWRTERRWA